MNILRSITQHSSGLNWIKQSKAWKLAIEYYEGNHTVYILREAASFLYDILEKFAELQDEEQCDEIVQELLKPILQYPWNEKDNVLLVDSEQDQKLFVPMLGVVSMILEKCLQSGKRSKTAYFILTKYKLENNLWRFCDITLDHDLIGHIMRCHVLGNYLRLSSIEFPANDPDKKDLDFKVFTTHFYNHIIYLIGRKSFRNIILATELNHKYWKMMGDRAPSENIEDNDAIIKFGDQVLIIQVFPVLFLLKTRYAQEINDYKYVEEFCQKILSISCTFTTRIVYSYRCVFCLFYSIKFFTIFVHTL